MHLFGFIFSLFLWVATGVIVALYGVRYHLKNSYSKKSQKKLKNNLLRLNIITAVFAGLFATLCNGTDTFEALIQNEVFVLIITLLTVLPHKKVYKILKKNYYKNKNKFSKRFLLFS